MGVASSPAWSRSLFRRFSASNSVEGDLHVPRARSLGGAGLLLPPGAQGGAAELPVHHAVGGAGDLRCHLRQAGGVPLAGVGGRDPGAALLPGAAAQRGQGEGQRQRGARLDGRPQAARAAVGRRRPRAHRQRREGAYPAPDHGAQERALPAARQIRPWPGFEGRQAALDAQFRRRAAAGKCFHQPYFGCREFPAWFRLVDGPSPLDPAPWPHDLDIGLMLYDVFDLTRPGTAADAPALQLFRAEVRAGVLAIPEPGSPDVYRAGGPA